MIKLLQLWISSALLLATISCGTMQTSDFEIMVKLPYSGDCAGLKVMSKKRTRYPKAQCEKMIERSIILTSDNYKMVRGDIQTNCQFQQCTQITGAADHLFLTVDQVLQKVPF